MAKNIVVFSDGTGQKGGQGTNTNVYKLFNIIEDRTARQISYYDPGVGTDWRRISGNISGSGISKNIMQCYRFIFENYEAGDRIYLFGFSRGAATVRSLSSYIHLFGILPKSRGDLIEKAYNIYKTRDMYKREKRAKDFINKHHTMWAKIHFLGVWDTVAALGLPNPLFSLMLDRVMPTRFHNFEISQSVEYVRHALALDERRKAFAPIYFEPLDKNSYCDEIKQVWFAGVHTDVGGGYPVEADEEVFGDNLSLFSYRWMIKEAQDKGLLIYKQENVEALWAVDDDRIVNGHMHNEGLGSVNSVLYTDEVRHWNIDQLGKPVVHESVLKRMMNANNTANPPYNPWILHHFHQDNLIVAHDSTHKALQEDEV